jgi:pimeloyl-ACP methyl ester carboxylesterase
MLSWREEFCERLAAGGRYVVRYDSRDAGRSTTYEPGAPQYEAPDAIADIVALIDELGIAPVHLFGLSGGAADAQLVALEYPDRVASLTLMASTPGEPGESPELPQPTPEIAAAFSEQAALPDWADRDQVVRYLIEAERPYAGSGGFDEEAMRELAERVAERTHNVASMVTNPFMVGGGEPWRNRLGEIGAPTLVIHGTDDLLFPLPHGEALAREIPGAELLVLDGVGHEYPPPRTWDEVVPAVLRHTAG